MEHDIGCKIKAARIEKKLTQEQVAELLGVSRQTISNWENEKSYPDIISVIKMSECYDVSLDYLLKGEQKMKSYYDYLEESTNVVKSNANRNKIITILSYLLIWAFAPWPYRTSCRKRACSRRQSNSSTPTPSRVPNGS